MPETFVAFIDESGDEGYEFLPPPQRKSTEWFALSAAIYRKSDLGQLDEHFAGFYWRKGEAQRRNVPLKPFHFRNSRHHECVAYAKYITASPITAVTVFAHKPSLSDETALRTQKHYLFDYTAKFLVERISWFCDERHKKDEDGAVRLIFSDRRQLKLDRVKLYLSRLRANSQLANAFSVEEWARNSIRWKVINFRLIEVQPHDSLTGLQVADAISTASTKAVEWTAYETTEHRYMKILANRFYRRGGKCRGYGVKFIPDKLPASLPLWPDRFHWLRHF